MRSITCTPVAELYDLAIVPGAMRPMSLGFGSNDILGLITHDPLTEGGLPFTQPVHKG